MSWAPPRLSPLQVVIWQAGEMTVVRAPSMGLAVRFAQGEHLAFRGRESEPRGARQHQEHRLLWLESAGGERGIVARGEHDGLAVACGSLRPIRHRPTGETGVALSYAVAKDWRGRGLGGFMAALALRDGVQLIQQEGTAVSSVWAEIRPQNAHSIGVAQRLGLSPVHPGLGEVVVFGGDVAACMEAAQAVLDEAMEPEHQAREYGLVCPAGG